MTREHFGKDGMEGVDGRLVGSFSQVGFPGWVLLDGMCFVLGFETVCLPDLDHEGLKKPERGSGMEVAIQSSLGFRIDMVVGSQSEKCLIANSEFRVQSGRNQILVIGEGFDTICKLAMTLLCGP